LINLLEIQRDNNNELKCEPGQVQYCTFRSDDIQSEQCVCKNRQHSHGNREIWIIFRWPKTCLFSVILKRCIYPQPNKIDSSIDEDAINNENVNEISDEIDEDLICQPNFYCLPKSLSCLFTNQCRSYGWCIPEHANDPIWLFWLLLFFYIQIFIKKIAYYGNYWYKLSISELHYRKTHCCLCDET